MSVSTGYTFDNAANFTLTNTQIDGALGKLSLTTNPAQTFTQNFAVDTGFTYNAANTEFAAGVMRQKSQAGSAIFAANYNTNANPITTEADLIWRTDAGSVSATLNGAPTIVGSKLVCTGTQGVGYTYTTTALESHKFKYTPNYAGGPPALINLIASKPAGSQDRFYLVHAAGLDFVNLAMWNNASGVVFGAAALLAWTPTAGQEYELELVIDSSTGNCYFFIDGTLSGTLSVAPWARGGIASNLDVGAHTATYNRAEASFDDYIYFDDVQHTTSYTPGYTIPLNLYLADSITAPAFSYTDVGEIQSLTSISVTEVGTPRYTLDAQYWNGSAWVSSDGTYAQANTLGDINTNIATIVLTSDTSVPFQVVFDSTAALSSVDDFVVTHVGQQYGTDGHIEPVQSIEAMALIGYAHVEVEPALTGLGVIISVDAVLMYWSGAAWVVSDGSFAQSNTEADVNTNLPSLTLGSNSTIVVRWVFNTTDQQETPTIASSTITYDFGAVEASTTICTVYGYVKDITDSPVANASVGFQLDTTSVNSYNEASSRVISTLSSDVVTDANGYFTIDLIRTSNYPDGGTYTIEITLSSGAVVGSGVANKLSFDVPDSTTKDITDLLPAA